MASSHARQVLIDVCEHPVFIVGAPRSATSAFAWSLARHSALWTSGESFFLFDLFAEGRLRRAWLNAAERPSESLIAMEGVKRRDFYEAVGLGVNGLLTKVAGGRRWVDHTPHYSLMVDELADIFSGASFVHLVRDGRRVVHSMVHFLDRLNPDDRAKTVSGGFAPPWATDFRTACQTWRDYVVTVSKFIDANPGRGITVQTNELSNHPATSFAQIFDFLGLSHEDAPAEHFRIARVNSSFGPDLIGTPSTDAVERPWDTWTAEQRLMFLEEAGQALVDTGFVDRIELGQLIQRARSAQNPGPTDELAFQ
jgi:hypothetical protein